MAKESNKERALTLEAIRVLDAIDRRGSFAAAADELGKVPSALSYTVQKLEDELDAMLFDRSGHRTKFTPAGRMLLERGRVLLEAAERRAAMARAKVQLGQSMRFVGQQSVQLHGGIGVTDEYIGSHYFKKLTQLEMTFGDTLHHLGEVSARMQDTAGVFA